MNSKTSKPDTPLALSLVGKENSKLIYE